MSVASQRHGRRWWLSMALGPPIGIANRPLGDPCLVPGDLHLADWGHLSHVAEELIASGLSRSAFPPCHASASSERDETATALWIRLGGFNLFSRRRRPAGRSWRSPIPTMPRQPRLSASRLAGSLSGWLACMAWESTHPTLPHPCCLWPALLRSGWICRRHGREGLLHPPAWAQLAQLRGHRPWEPWACGVSGGAPGLIQSSGTGSRYRRRGLRLGMGSPGSAIDESGGRPTPPASTGPCGAYLEPGAKTMAQESMMQAE